MAEATLEGTAAVVPMAVAGILEAGRVACSFSNRSRCSPCRTRSFWIRLPHRRLRTHHCPRSCKYFRTHQAGSVVARAVVVRAVAVDGVEEKAVAEKEVGLAVGWEGASAGAMAADSVVGGLAVGRAVVMAVVMAVAVAAVGVIVVVVVVGEGGGLRT